MEDASYRTSSQYRLWTFTPDSLATVRKATNAAASAQVKAAIHRAREKKKRKMNNGDIFGGSLDRSSGSPDSGDGGVGEEKEIDCLTPEEELKLVRYYCRKIMEIATVFEFPTNIKATAPTFLRRFFTRTSPMTYHPKTLLSTILYLTTKTENHYISLSNFSAKIPNSSPEEILAPEFVVAMGLRWCFEVKHPFRGLEGAIMELMKVCEGTYKPPSPLPTATTSNPPNGESVPPPPPAPFTPSEWQAKLQSLPPYAGSTANPPLEPKPRIERAHGKARAILSSSVLLTDAYFLFTPPQIYLAAIYIVDTPLARLFLDLKLPDSDPAKAKLITIIEKCADEIRTGGDPGAPISKAELEEVKKIDRKLYFCRNPEKVDLMAVNKLAKRGVTEDDEGSGIGNGGDGSGTATGSVGSGGITESERRERDVKKRKLEREKSFREGEELFGPPMAEKRK